MTARQKYLIACGLLRKAREQEIVDFSRWDKSAKAREKAQARVDRAQKAMVGPSEEDGA